MPMKFSKQHGFTLIEIAIVIVIIGILIGTILGPISSQTRNSNIKKTETTINQVNDLLMAYFAANGHLPCPATDATNGVESRVGFVLTNGCTTQHGYVPSVTLAINGNTNENNQLVDAWTMPIRYSVDDRFSDSGLVDLDGLLDELSALPLLGFLGDANAALSVCTQSDCSQGNVVANSVPAVVFSTGPDRNTFVSDAQTENLDEDNVFISKPPTQLEGEEFDDIVDWISPNLLKSYLIELNL